MTQLHAYNIERYSAETLGFVDNVICVNENKLSLLIHKLLDEPWTGDAIDLHLFASYPLHS